MPIPQSSHEINKTRSKPLFGSTPYLYHVCSRLDWEQALPNQYHQKGPFTHLSTAEELDQSVRLHLHQFMDLLLICVKTDRIGSALKWEEVKTRKTLMPHLYGPLITDSIQWMIHLPNLPDEQGSRCPPIDQLKKGKRPNHQDRFPPFV